MGSIQSGVVNLLARTVRNSFFIHKAETSTQRNSFERLAHFAKFPRFVKSETIEYAGMEAMAFYPKKMSKNRIVLYLHGGGYTVGSVRTHKALIARIARAAKCKAIGVNYRLAPEDPHPAALNDCKSAYKQLIADGYTNIFLAGDSAGGGLTLALMMELRDQGELMPMGATIISPWTDLTMSGESIRTKEHLDPLIDPGILKSFSFKYVGDGDPTDPMVSPLYGDLRNLPPILIQVGGNEILLDDSTRLAKKLKKAGCKVELEIWGNMFHVWHYLAGIIPESQEAIRQIGDFVKKTYKAGKGGLVIAKTLSKQEKAKLAKPA